MRKEISNKIRLLAFVFTVGIVFYHLKWHGNIGIHYLGDADWFLMQSFFYLLEKLGFICMSFFFFFSAFWFYKDGINRDELMIKWKKRIKTLLVPYLCWTLIVFLYEFLTKGDFLSGHGFVYWLFLHPIVGPLWYILGLLILQFIAPIFLIFKNKKLLNTLVFLAIALWAILRNLGIVPHVFNFENWWWYNNMIYYVPIYLLGAYVGLYHSELVVEKTCSGKKFFIAGIGILIAGMLLWIKFGDQFAFLYALILLAGLWFVLQPQIFKKEMPEFLRSDFYIYALHQPVLIPLIDEITFAMINESDMVGFAVVVMKISQVAVIVLLCCIIRFLIRRFLPRRVDNLLTGGR